MNENSILDLMIILKDIDSFKASYNRTQANLFEDIKRQIQESAKDTTVLINDIKDYGSMIREEAFINGLQQGIKLCNLMNKM